MQNDAWGLALAGGGGKGSYQIGVWRALKESGYEKQIAGVSGASVGALNALLFANQDFEKAENIWFSIRPIQFLNPADSLSHLPDADGNAVGLLRRAGAHGLCSRDGLRSILQNDVELSRISSAKVALYVCLTQCGGAQRAKGASAEAALQETPLDASTFAGFAGSLLARLENRLLDASCAPDGRAAVYMRLNSMDAETITNAVLASSAMPYIYEPVQIGGRLYRDGGLSDNVPIRPLVAQGIKNLIIVKLEPDDEVDTRLYSQCRHIIEIVPSQEIGDLLDGTLDFGQKSVPFRMKLGYFDALRILKQFERKQRS